MTLDLFCELIRGCWILIPFLPSNFKAAFHCIHFRNLLPLSSVDIFIQAIRILGFTELYRDAGRVIITLDMDCDLTKLAA